MRVLIFPVLTTLFTTQAATVIFRSDEPQYRADYNVDATDPNNPQLFVQLELLNYDISNWTNTDGGEGVMMGIGLGTQVWGQSDLIICNYTQNASLTVEKFNCFDYHVLEDGTVMLDDQQDIQSVFNPYPFENRTVTLTVTSTNSSTNETIVTEVNQTKADFIVSFVRNLQTNDSMDTQLSRGVIDSYWVYGPIFANQINVSQQASVPGHFGGSQLDLSEPQQPVTSTPNSGSGNLLYSSCFALIGMLIMLSMQI
ncbi:UNKNOWN [Stylonychia lemnae]|uniref:DOMON domain-containing protein n=1 Tax=Stylonychia lemnae TaxID=5949 RepID=A0A078B1C2_STYLE|nr:UNKNOWN [Stylonychia lemnae]|eukprot:CDW86968.1 UNKNOWN [Stylonychia lemnae]